MKENHQILIWVPLIASQEQLLLIKGWKETYLNHSKLVTDSQLVPQLHSNSFYMFHTTHWNLQPVQLLDLTESWPTFKDQFHEPITSTDLNCWRRWYYSFSKGTAKLWPELVGEGKKVPGNSLESQSSTQYLFQRTHLSAYAAGKLHRLSCLQLLAQSNYTLQFEELPMKWGSQPFPVKDWPKQEEFPSSAKTYFPEEKNFIQHMTNTLHRSRLAGS